MSDNNKPKPGTRKIAVGSLAGAAITVLVWLIETTTNISVPPQVATALGTLLTAIFVYLTPEAYYNR